MLCKFCIPLFCLWLMGAPLSVQIAGANDTNSPNQNKKEEKKEKNGKQKEDPKKDPEQIGSRDVGKGVNWYSIEKEVAIGKALAQQVEAQVKLIDDPVISEYVNRIGQNLVRNSDAKVPFTIKVIDSDEVNAFALPGGFFFINSGVLIEADDESELAGVMAHEIAHVAARHGTRTATRGEIANILSIPLIFLGGGVGYGARQAAGILVPVGFLKFSRAFEKEADMLGLQYMYKTGYDPQSLVTAFEKLQAKEKKKPGTLSKIFASHPQISDRISESQKIINGFRPLESYIITTSEFDIVKERLAQLHALTRGSKKTGDHPTLRKTTQAPDETKDTKEEKKEDEEKRPTLKRRP